MGSGEGELGKKIDRPPLEFIRMLKNETRSWVGEVVERAR